MKSRYPLRYVMALTDEVQVNRGSDFNPTEGFRVRWLLSCGHKTKWLPGSRPATERKRCVLCAPCE